MPKKATRNAVHLYDSTRSVDDGHVVQVVSYLVTDDPADDSRPIEVEMTPWQAIRWAKSLEAAARRADPSL